MTHEVIDTHQHIGGSAALSGAGTQVAVAEEARARCDAMDACGITWAIIQPSQMYLRPDGDAQTRAINDLVAAFRAEAPERFRIALGTVEPLSGESGAAEVFRCGGALGLQGLAWHHRFQGCYIDTPLMTPLLEALRETGGVAAVHTNAESQLEALWRLCKVAREFREITFIAHDAFFSWEEAEHALYAAEHVPNVIWDVGGPLAAWPLFFAHLESWILRHGAERLAFSAEIGYAAAGTARSPFLELIRSSRLPEDSRRMLLAGSVRRACAGILG